MGKSPVVDGNLTIANMLEGREPAVFATSPSAPIGDAANTMGSKKIGL